MSAGLHKTASHSGPCTTCELCQKGNPKMKSLIQMKVQEKYQEVYQWLKSEKPTLSDTACICLPCTKQIQRNHNNPSFTPRWLPKPQKPLCSVEGCQATMHCQTSLVSPDELGQILQKRICAFQIENSEQSISVCQKHYNLMYSHLHDVKPCESCGAKPKRGGEYFRHCPSPLVVNNYLNHISTETCSLSTASIICHPCYKYFQNILRQLKTVNDESPTLSKGDIDTVLGTLSQEIQETEAKGENMTHDDYLALIMCFTSQKLARAMKADEAVLLPTLYGSFFTEVQSRISHYPFLEPIGEKEIPGKRWLLSRLHSHFGEMLTVSCKHNRYGSVLFHKNCDLVKALSAALGRSKHMAVQQKRECSPSSSVQHQQISTSEQMENVAHDLNHRLVRQAKTLIASFQDSPEKYAKLDITTLSSQVDPTLLQFIQLLTQSVRSKRRKLFQSETEVGQTKSVRQLYILCMLLFCTNTQCSMPFHTVLTEAILCNGGSHELVKIFNRIGAVASLDTNLRLATQVVQARIAHGVLPELAVNAVSIVSIDNIDILQPHAFVSCTDATRSWHGTSVQCVQPLPQSALLQEEEVFQVRAGRATGKHPAPSPTASPIPVEKAKRRRRTLTELPSPHSTVSIPEQVPISSAFDCEDGTSYQLPTISGIHVEDFRLNAMEKGSVQVLHEDVFKCMMLKYAKQNTNYLPGLPSLLNCVRKQSTSCEVSNVVYVQISSERADSKPTLINILGQMHKIFIVGHRQKYLLVVGDGKTYDLLQDIRSEYGDHLTWCIPFPGDWHILLNYQKVLMKVYADAGFSKLGEVSQHRGETLTSLINCSNFRRTHHFLLQTMEAFYRFFLSLYISDKSSPSTDSPSQASGDINAVLASLVTSFSSITSDDELDVFRKKVDTQLSVQAAEFCFSDFHSFMDRLSQKQDTIRFWYQFVSTDILAYLGLFVGLRYRNWDLRTGSIKQLAAIFSAFDRPVYQRLIPTHIHDLLTLPKPLLEHLQQGCFSVRLTPSEWHGVALDECHEMKINKDAKLAVVRPSVHKMEHLSNHLPFRAACINNLTEQLFPEMKERTTKFSHRPTSKDIKAETNIQRMLDAIAAHGMFHSECENKGLWNFLESKQANSEQTHDLLQFRRIGQAAFEDYVQSNLLNQPSTDTPIRRKRLCTFSTSQAEQRRVKQVEKEAKLSQRYLKRAMAWLAEHGSEGVDLETLLGPPSPLPRALIDANGLPYKGTKSTSTTYLQRRYKHPPIIIQELPAGWIPDTVILEGMFLIQTSPISTMSCMQDYVKLLLSRFVRPHFIAGVKSVHVVFDVPGAQHETPKEIEQYRRDRTADATGNRQHYCTSFSDDLLVPDKWRSILACRRCKKDLTAYIADDMLNLISHSLRPYQQFITNIGEEAFSIAPGRPREMRPDLHTNADEADLRVWLHCKKAFGRRKLIFSPDTDVYHIGLSEITHIPDTEIIVQLNNTCESVRYLSINNLLTALQNDPDLSQLPPCTRPQALQSLYVATGCDYTSFFVGLGKVSFLATFYQHASFIAGGSDPPGTIGVTCLDSESPSKFSFLRLVGCSYFRQHTSGFKLQTPEALYYSISDATSCYDHHDKWLAKIRTIVRQRVDRENKSMPSTDALLLHWRRCTWVLGMWHCATQNRIELPALTDYGWRRENGVLQVDWEVQANIDKAKACLEFVLAGCKCRTGCSTRRCSCKKNDRMCGPSCNCINCTNSTHTPVPSSNDTTDLEVQDLLNEPTENEYVDDSGDDLEEMREDEELTEIVNFVFGPESDEEDLA